MATVRRCRPLDNRDLDGALALYRDLVGDIPLPEGDAAAASWAAILAHPDTTVWGLEVDGEIRAMATLHILPNMTFGARPYALVENVVTSTLHQGQGFGRRLMDYVISQAWDAGVYKIMLLTGTSIGARGFYEKLGFSGDQKHGMIMRCAPQRNPAS